MAGGPVASAASSSLPLPVTISDGWQLQDAAKVPEAGAVIAAAKYKSRGWYARYRARNCVDEPGKEWRLPGAFVWGEQSSGQDSRQFVAYALLVSNGLQGTEELCGTACVAELRWDKLFSAGVGKRAASWCDEGRLRPGDL